MSRPPSGQQHTIAAGEHTATIVEVGGGIRTLRRGDRDVLHPYDESAMCDGAHGTPLIPWPNRIGDGTYDFDGTSYELALTEPAKHNAIHGLLRWVSWAPLEHRPDRITMAAMVNPTQGYPFALEVTVTYVLDATGLTVTTTATNVGDQVCPYGVGQHPYLSPGDGLIDGGTLHLDAGTRILTTPDRQLPAGREAVEGTAYDLRTPRPIGDLELDFAFTDLQRDADGRAWLSLTGADGRTSRLWVDRTYPIIEVFTADTLAPERRRRGLGAEPMSCPPDAFTTGEGVLRLEPGGSHSSTWGAELV